MKCIERDLADRLKEMTSRFPLVFLTGPRKSGKSVLLKNSALKNFEYTSLEDPTMRDFAVNDPKGFLNTFSESVIIDDVHWAAALLPYIQARIDEKGSPKTFIISGRLEAPVSKTISQLLGGRAVKLTLLPFSLSELAKEGWLPKTVNEWMYTGNYPELFSTTAEPQSFFHKYTSDLIELDIKPELKVHGFNKFRRFLDIIAAYSANTINFSRLAEEMSIDARTANSWISILEEMFILFRLAPYRDYSGKRYVKTPKLYFYDSGFLCFLLGITKPEELNFHQMRNQIFETAVISEAAKKYLNAGFRTKMYYLRDLDNKEKEVDLIEESPKALKLTEIKLSQTANEGYTKNLVYFSLQPDILSPGKTISSQVIYDGSESLVFENIPYINWKLPGE